MKYTCIEVFCGAGGLAYGLKKAGFKVLYAFDHNESAIKTFKHNINKKAVIADALKISAEEIIKKTKLAKGELTLLSGGPPCQGFSRQNKNGENGDKRNRLIVKYIRLVQGIEPKFFLLENVDTFKKKRGQAYLNLLQQGLTNTYNIMVREINCADFGVPQTRKRTIVIGVRKDINCIYTFPEVSHPQYKWVTVRQALKGLDSPPADGSEHPELPNHTLANITEINRERIKYVPQGSGRKCLPRRLQLQCHKKKTGWPDVYGRMSWDKPAPTITGGFDNFTRGRFAHPQEHRPITSREAAILQSFDNKFEFFGTKGDIRQQIGNAVPPLLAKVLGKSIITALKAAEVTSLK
ncbi:DNA cytosine methyltransferase [Paenibacillus sp. FSL P2-0136]|uniref:DNA cytosine methyltransferase n=1 Tax=unclassified Paenibacillus TaxID=185978 RepID=UPI0030D6F631